MSPSGVEGLKAGKIQRSKTSPGQDQRRPDKAAATSKFSASGGGGSVAKLCPTLRPHGLVACQAPLSMGFSRQEYWSGLPFLPPGDFPKPRTEPGSPVLQADQLSYKGSSQQPQGCWKEKEKATGVRAEKDAGALGTAGQHLWVRPVRKRLTSILNTTPTKHFLPRVYRRGSWGPGGPASGRRAEKSPSEVGDISTPVFFLLNIKTTPAFKLPISDILKRTGKAYSSWQQKWKK